MEEYTNYQLAGESTPLTLENSSDNYGVALSMLQQTRRNVAILSRHLDGRLYNTTEFIQALTNLAVQHPRCRIRVLLRDMEPLVKYGHRIIELSRRLSSIIGIRTIHEDYREYNEAYMVFDERGIIKRRYADRYEGIANFNDPKQAQEMLSFFNEVWNVSEPDPNLRRLHI
jgi:HEPN domain-containing protein